MKQSVVLSDILSRRVKMLREQAGWTQAVLSELSGVSIAAIKGIEGGATHEPKIGALVSVADCFDVSVDYLIGRSDRQREFFNRSW